MPRVLRILITGSAFFVFFSGGLLLGWLLLPLIGIFGWTKRGRHRLRVAFMSGAYRFFIGYMRVGGLISVRCQPRPPDFPGAGEPFVMISNHPSLIDVVHLMAMFPGMASMAAHHYYKSVFIGRLLQITGQISGPPPGGSAGETTILDAMVAHLKSGGSLLVFPEGTRSPLRGLRRFRRGAFEAAVRAQVPIVPVFISQDPPTLMKGQRWYEVPYRRIGYEFEFFPIIHTAGQDIDARALHKETEALYQQRCKRMLAERDANARAHGDPPMIDRSSRPTDRILGPAPNAPGD